MDATAHNQSSFGEAIWQNVLRKEPFSFRQVITLPNLNGGRLRQAGQQLLHHTQNFSEDATSLADACVGRRKFAFAQECFSPLTQDAIACNLRSFQEGHQT